MTHRPTNNPGALAEGNHGSVLADALTQTLNQGASSPFLVRVVVEDVIFDPTMIDDKREQYYSQDGKLADKTFLRSLPPNTIIGRPVRDGTTSGADGSQYFFPFFPPHMMFPIKPGEHVWVFYENNKDTHYGYWMFRITEPRHVDDLNYTHADRKFQGVAIKGAEAQFEQGDSEDKPNFANTPIRKINGDPKPEATGASYGDTEKAYEDLIQKSDAGKVSDFEEVPRYKKRPGDFAVQGSNNTLIVLGTDRNGEVAETDTDKEKGKIAKGKPKKDKKGKAGAIDVVVGRGQGDRTKPKDVASNTIGNKEVNKNLKKENPNEGDPDFDTDLGRFYLAMKTDVDGNFKIDFSGGPGGKSGAAPVAADDSKDAPAAVIKVDHIRLVARKTMKILVQPNADSKESECGGIVINQNGDIIFLPSSKGLVLLGGADADKAVLGFDAGATAAGGQVTSPPMVSTMGGAVGVGPGSAHGVFATKVLMK